MLWVELADGSSILWDSCPCKTDMTSAHQVDGIVTGREATGFAHHCCSDRAEPACFKAICWGRLKLEWL